MMTCIYISPENRFKYVWKILIPDKPASILPNDSAVVVVRRAMRSFTYLCETQENGSIIASVKYTVKAATEYTSRRINWITWSDFASAGGFLHLPVALMLSPGTQLRSMFK
uniref:Sperm acrosome associated 1 n=1 Tax=Meleagris gallopavo TaxID=9103 RepID=G1NRW2_MELGA